MKKSGKFLAVVAVLATLTAGVMAGCGITEKPDDEKPQTGAVSLDKETLALDADRIEKLNATGADEIVWESDNPAIATVDSQGNVTGVNAGTCKITASTKDGNYEAECTVTVTGYHLSKNVFAGITKIENNTYNGEVNYAVDNSSEDAFVVSYDRSVMTNSWTSLVLWYDCNLSPTSFDVEFEVTKGSLPCLQFEFGGESSFKQFERFAVTEGKNTVSLNTTDIDLDGEGSWKAIYLELNNPCPLGGTTDEVKGETEIKFTGIKLVEGEKKAPEAPANAEVTDGVVYWDRVLAASEYELEVDGKAITDLSSRTRASGDAPVMRRAYKPTAEKEFAAGEHTAKIRSKNSAGVSEWKEFTFTVAGEEQEEPAAFIGINSKGNNQWNTTPDFYTATEQEDGSIKISFTGATTDEWSTYLFGFDTATIEATKLHIKLHLASGELEKVRYQVDGSSGTIYGADLVFDADGYAELTVDVTSEGLASSYGSVMLFLNKYATAGSAYEVEVIDVSLT